MELYHVAKKVVMCPYPDWKTTHEIDANMWCAWSQGFSDTTPAQYVKHESAETIKGTVGIHAGCFTGQWKCKRWPYFDELAKYLLEAGLSIKLFGSKDESLEIKKIENFCGKLELQDTINEMVKCEYFIANDSGLSHVADALNLKNLQIFGATSHIKNGGVNKNFHKIISDFPCAPCQYTDRWITCGDYKCMNDMSLEKVLKIINKIWPELKLNGK